MTVASSINRAGPYDTNGVTVNFAYGFLIFDEEHLDVYQTDKATEVDVLLVLGTDYTVTGVDEPAGGNVVINPAMATGYEITIVREVPQIQETDLSNQGSWLPEVHEAVFDRLTMMIQDLQEQVDRSVKVGVNGTIPDDYLGDCQEAAAAAAISAAAALAAQIAAELAQAMAEAAAQGHHTNAVIDPTVDDDIDAGYVVNHVWFNTASSEVFMCTDSTSGAAVWASMGIFSPPGGWDEGGSFTRVSDFTFTVTDNPANQGIYTPGRPIRYADTPGTWRYAIVNSYVAGLVTFWGAAMTTDFDAYMQYGPMEKVAQIELHIAGPYGDGIQADLLAADMNAYCQWLLGPSHLVMVSAAHKTVDSGTEPDINVNFGSNDVLLADLTLGASGARVYSPNAGVDPAHYRIDLGDSIEVSCIAAGGSGDAEDLSITLVLIME